MKFNLPKAFKPKGLGLAVLSGLALSAYSGDTYAQCAVPTITSATTVATTCLGNGEIHVDADISDAVYSIQSGPISVSEENDHGNFFSLPPGSYVVRAYNPSGAGCFTDTTLVIEDTYTPFSFSLSVSNVCVSGEAGTIDVTTVTGSSTPLTVAYWQGSPSAPDASLTYETIFTKNVSATGVWNVRVKDACGEAITQQVTISNPYPNALRVGGIRALPSTSMTCADDSITMWIGVYSDGIFINHTTLPAEGVYVDVYEDIAGTCVIDPTKFVKTINITPSSSSLDFVMPKNKKLIFVTRTPCGESTTRCYDGIAAQTKDAWSVISQYGCTTPDHPDGTIQLEFGVNDYVIFPITYTVVSSDPTYNTTGTMTSSRWQFLPDYPYGETFEITLTDACGDVLTTTITSPTPTSAGGSGLEITGVQRNLSYCTNENGKITVTLLLDGYFVGLADYDGRIEAEIISGPDAGVVGFRYDSYRYVFSNITPGATNTVKFTNTVCGNEATLDFTADMIIPFNQDISLEVEQLCDLEGKGNITVNTSYNNSTGTIVYSVYKEGISTPIYTGAGATFTLPNQDAGNYYAVMTVSFPTETGCTGYSLNSNIVTILPGGTAPIITKKVSMVCEDEFGNPTSNGNASLEFIGAAPFLVEYKLSSSSTWTTHSEESMGEELIEGLLVDATYNLRITDQCGMIRTDNVTIGTLAPLFIENEAQPCLGESYTVVAPTFANATYSWSKDGTSLPAYTENSFAIPVFAESNTGSYQCVITIGTCVVRVINFTLYSQLCDQPFGELSISGNVFNDANGLNDGMVNGTGTNISGTLFAVLTDADGLVIGSVAVNADGSYKFDNLDAGEYKIVISNGKPASGSTMTTGSLPSGWVSTGENIGLPTTTGHDGTIDGASTTITLSTSNVDNINFGIDHQPESFDKTLTVSDAPVVGVPVELTVPLTGSDPEDNGDTEETWSTTPIIITTLPTNGFELVYDGVVLEAGDTINNYDPTLLSIVPTSSTPEGTTETEFTYATVDAAGVVDPTPAVYEVTFEIPLNIKDLLTFEATKKGNIAHLDWSTKADHTIAKFELERSSDSRNWISINEISAKEAINSSDYNYSYVDEQPLQSKNYYRLKVTGTDGSIGYSQFKLLIFDIIDQVRIQPNPARSYVEVLGLKGGEKINVVDMTGKIVLEAIATQNQSTLDIHHLPEGVYIINVMNGTSTISTNKLVVNK